MIVLEGDPVSSLLPLAAVTLTDAAEAAPAPSATSTSHSDSAVRTLGRYTAMYEPLMGAAQATVMRCPRRMPVEGTRPHSLNADRLADPVQVELPTSTRAPAMDAQQQSDRVVMATAATEEVCLRGAVHQGLLRVGSASSEQRAGGSQKRRIWGK